MHKKASGIVLGLLAIIGVVAATCTPGTIETARIAGDKAKAIELSGRELGLICLTNTEGCAELIARAEKNPQLKEAFLKAKSAGVGIHPHALSPFVGHAGSGYVIVNTWYGDEKIIAFLTR